MWSESKGAATEDFGNGVMLRLRHISAGSFLMSSKEETTENAGDEEAPRLVMIDTGFWMGETEVTQEQWLSLMDVNPSYFVGPDLPVHGLSWVQSVEFCRRLSDATGIPFALPTEVQWEYAARAGTTTVYYWGNGFTGVDTHEWYFNNSNSGATPSGSPLPESVLGYRATSDQMKYIGIDIKGHFPHRVGTKKLNPWGIYDILGNVSEWCGIPSDSPNPLSKKGGNEKEDAKNGPRYRGGNYLSFLPKELLPGYGGLGDEVPKNVWPDIGLRVVCEENPQRTPIEKTENEKVGR